MPFVTGKKAPTPRQNSDVIIRKGGRFLKILLFKVMPLVTIATGYSLWPYLEKPAYQYWQTSDTHAYLERRMAVLTEDRSNQVSAQNSAEPYDSGTRGYSAENRASLDALIEKNQ